MNEPAGLGLFVAFAAGLLSFLSPCVLPLVPSYIGFLTGMSLPEATGRKRPALVHAILFVAGFSLVFILLGASATALGRALNQYQVWIQRIGGVLISAFGLVCLGVFRADFLMRDRRVQVEQKPVGYLGSAVVGTEPGHKSSGKTECIYQPAGGVSPYVEFSVEWGEGETAMKAAAAMGQGKPGPSDPYAGIGDQAISVGTTLWIRSGKDCVQIVFSGVNDAPAKAKKIFNTAKARM